jgi:tetratricopeptide (TPR) repeat protein
VLPTVADSPTVGDLYPHTCRGMGELLEYEAPQKALVWLRRGLEEPEAVSAEEQAALYMKIGSVQIGTGDYAAALDALEKALELLPEHQTWQRAGILTNLGNIVFYQGNLDRASEYMLQGLEISHQLNDHYQMLLLQSNLAVFREIAGDWDGAVADHQQALKLAEQLGSVSEEIRIENNLALLYSNKGENGLAKHYLSHALDLARKHNLREQLIHILSNQADLLLREGEPDAAKPLLADAERVALELDSKYQLPEIYRCWAQVQLTNGQPGAALMNAERGVNMARELGMELEEGIGLRILGLALLADDQTEPALTAFEKSLSMLADQDPYEAARTRLEWGRHLASDTDTERGQALLREARTAFQELGAKRDLAAVDEILAQ